MAGQIEIALRTMTAAFDRKDFKAVVRAFTVDAQGIDEISRKWIRGRAGIDAYMQQIDATISGVKTLLRDIDERAWGDVGVVTCWLEQDYVVSGRAHHVSSPTTVIMRKQGGNWKIALFHSIPLGEKPGG